MCNKDYFMCHQDMILCMILTNPRARYTDVLFMRWQIQIITHIVKMIRWCIGSAIPINDFVDCWHQKYEAG